MKIPNKMGFHFHDTYLQIAVDLGVIGLSVLIATLMSFSHGCRDLML
jgi:O-antigen ligase